MYGPVCAYQKSREKKIISDIEQKIIYLYTGTVDIVDFASPLFFHDNIAALLLLPI